jgi:hypothetical protein
MCPPKKGKKKLFACRALWAPNQRTKSTYFSSRKNMQFGAGEKYVILGRRKICTFGPAKNMHFGAGEKYVILGRRKICDFGPTKNMYFWSGEGGGATKGEMRLFEHPPFASLA